MSLKRRIIVIDQCADQAVGGCAMKFTGYSAKCAEALGKTSNEEPASGAAPPVNWTERCAAALGGAANQNRSSDLSAADRAAQDNEYKARLEAELAKMTPAEIKALTWTDKVNMALGRPIVKEKK